MKKISSTSTWLYKKLFPFAWFGFLSIFFVIAFVSGAVWSQGWILIPVLCVMGLAGYYIMKKLVWDLADEVQDYGEYLVVRFKGEEERIPLSNVMHVNITANVNPARITLRLVNPGKFGSEVSFSPPAKASFNPFAKNEVAEDLIVRVDQARVRRA